MAKVARGVPASTVIIPCAASFAGSWAVEDAAPAARASGPPASLVCDGSHAFVVLSEPAVLLKVRPLDEMGTGGGGGR